LRNTKYIPSSFSSPCQASWVAAHPQRQKGQFNYCVGNQAAQGQKGFGENDIALFRIHHVIYRSKGVKNEREKASALFLWGKNGRETIYAELPKLGY